MKKNVLIILLLLPSIFVKADLLDELDVYIGRHNSMVANYQDSLSALSKKNTYKSNKAMYEAYSAFKYDSAYYYADRNIRLINASPQQYRPTDIIDAQLDMVHILSVAGLFSEAEYMLQELTSILENINLTKDVDDDSTIIDLKIKFYTYAGDLYLYKSEYSDRHYFDEYNSKSLAYRQKIIDTAPKGSYDYQFALAIIEDEADNHDTAIQLLEQLLETLTQGDRKYSVVSGTLAYFYSFKQDIEKQKHYFALSAISDIKGNICETNSLRALATLLYQENQIERAYNYLYVSVQDAQFYGSRLRTFQTGQITPLIVKAWQDEQKKSRRLLQLQLLLATLLVLLLIISFVAATITLRRISKKNQIINKQKENIELINQQLKESNKIKLEYVSRYMMLASNYITEFDKNRKQVNKLMMEGKKTEVEKMLKSPSLEQRNVQTFHHTFDTAFLNIYPTFISAVNRLLTADNQIIPKEGEKLSTELRILALLRLGISDNQQIAEILRSSITTIYTYRSRLRSKAVQPATFEQDIMLIGANLE
ncbi:MAG: hypothetical protein IJ834_04170 [Paludibacteraceae bacterium]|nr:hypothetical protein [Paludibacteraceae bacterium]